MIKKIVLCLFAMSSVVSFVFAEPLVLEQAGNVLESKALEVGLGDLTYQSDITSIINNSNVETMKITNTSVSMPLTARYALNNSWEMSLNLPNNSVNTKVEANGAATTSATSGIADMLLSAKWSFNSNLSIIGAFSLPTGAAAFREGLNIHTIVAWKKDLGKLMLNVNAGYNLTSEYENESKVKIDPANVMGLAVGCEYPVFGKVNGITEFIYSNLGEAKVAGAAVAQSSGSTMDLFFGGRMNSKNFKTKVGIGLSLGEEKFRSYDYKIIAGLTYLINL